MNSFCGTLSPSSDPPTNAPSLILQVLFVSPTQPLNDFPSKSGLASPPSEVKHAKVTPKAIKEAVFMGRYLPVGPSLSSVQPSQHFVRFSGFVKQSQMTEIACSPAQVHIRFRQIFVRGHERAALAKQRMRNCHRFTQCFKPPQRVRPCQRRKIGSSLSFEQLCAVRNHRGDSGGIVA